MPRKRVVLTGANGYISSLILPALQARYDLVLLDSFGGQAGGNTLPWGGTDALPSSPGGSSLSPSRSCPCTSRTRQRGRTACANSPGSPP